MPSRPATASSRRGSSFLRLLPTRRGTRWQLRATDVDLLGHVNNAAYWHAVEERLARGGPGYSPTAACPPRLPAPARSGNDVELVEVADEERLTLAFCVGDDVKAVAVTEALAHN